MLKLLIVDDEPMFREGLVKTINWEALGVCVAGEAFNGLEALKIIDSLAIDLVLTDIRMPELDGLELIRRVTEKRSDIRFIVISAYDDFSQVKQAFQLGIVDYILKSEINSDELMEIINRQRKEFDSVKRIGGNEIREYARRTDRMFLQQVLRNCIDRKLSLRDIPELMEYIGQSEESPVCSSVMSFHNIDSSSSPEQIAGERNQAKLIIDNYLEDSVEWVGYWDSSFLILFLSSREGIDWQTFSVKTEGLRQELSNLIQQEFPFLKMTAGFSSVKPARKPYLQKREAEKACLYSFFRGIDRSISFNHYQRSLDFTEMDGNALFRSFVSTLNSREFDHLIENISLYQFKPLQCNALQRDGILNLYRKYYYHLLSFSGQLGLDDCIPLQKQLDVYLSLKESGAPLEDLNEWLKKTLVLIRDKSDKSLSLCSKVGQYLEEHYSRDISLTDAAHEFQVNSSYLSRIFSRETGTGFSQYLLEVRIGKAIELMENSNLKIYEIAEEVGFLSPESFSRGFKKVTGTSPSNYSR